MSPPGPGSSGRARRAFRFLAANLLWLAVGLAVVGAAAEIALRLSNPFMTSRQPRVFRPGVGFLLQPGAEVRATNGLDYWTTDRVNRLGFRDREPPSPERAAAGCHLAVIGDSFVEGKQVPLADRLHLRLEDLAEEHLPDLDLTTSAFGLGDTGQVQQLAFYDEFARRRRPKVLALVAAPNDLVDNHALLRAVQRGWDPERPPEPSAVRRPDGSFEWRPPFAESAEPALRPPPGATLRRWVRRSFFASWLEAQWRVDRFRRRPDEMLSRLEEMRRRPEYAEALRDYHPASRNEALRMFARPEPPPAIGDAWDSTAFALREFRRRADGIGAAPVLLAVHIFATVQAGADREQAGLGGRAANLMDRVRALAADAGIPVLDQGAEIRRRGGTIREVHFEHDGHWNEAGHRLAAEMVFDWLKENRAVCDRPEPEEAATAAARALPR